MPPAILILLPLLIAQPVLAQTAVFQQRAGGHEFTLRLPPDGLFAQEEIEVAFRVSALRNSGEAVPLSFARLQAVVDMPSMPGMPKFEETAHSHGIAGEYGVHPTFPHGGEYRLRITFQQPSGQPPTSVEFPLQVGDATAESRARANARQSPYRLNVVTVPAQPKAGEPVELRLSVTLVNTLDQRTLTAFEIMHEKRMHLFLVRTDLGQFAHVHPELTEGGTFVLRHTFPAGGLYRIFADIAPKHAGSQVLTENLRIAGGPGKFFNLYSASVGDKGWKQQVEDMTLELQLPQAPLPIRKTIVLNATLRDAKGKAPAGIEPYLGAMGHLFLINEDTKTFVHSHPDDRTPAPPGALPFLTRFPKPGLYRGWMQVQRNNEVHTTSFILRAE